MAHPWWESTVAWSGIGVVFVGFIAAIVVILLIITISRAQTRRKS
jgi:hypothetical protein